ncbi:unnamed protein product [Pedinophyceae sp. YPF-701]|nr:unnamed protein product [Pedinophyceae sp. YPF-701]
MVPLNDAELKAISSGDFPAESGVYGVYNDKDELQYLGLSRKIDVSLKVHAEELPAEAVKARAMPLPGASKEALQAAWKAWMQEHLNEAGALPPGNNPGEKRWQMRAKKPARPDLKLTSGKGLADLNVPLEKLIDECIKATPVIAFVKGTKEMPQCGFSHRMMLTLNNLGADYEVVNVLDEVYNPGVREAIKEYSAWPTIPQLYIQGEFVGGADVVDEMLVSGELQEMLAGVKGAASK